MGKGDARSVRKSVAVTPLLERVLAHPAEYGLERNVSESKALQVLAERGARFSAETQRHDAELRAYAAYAQDEERLAVASDIQRAALESGAM